MNIIIFGPPGAGKGTQSNFIVKKFHLHQLSTGELLRKEIKDGTELGKQISSIINSGNLVSNEIVSDLIEKYISNKIYKNRLIFDGYPRNLNQATNLDNLLNKYDQKVDIALKLSVSLKTIKKRMIDNQCAGLLAPSDWRVVKATETGGTMDSGWKTWRASVRTKCNSMQTQIDNASDIDALAALFTYTTKDGVTSRPLGEFPVKE